jgi:CheY-like chemotaxis protein
MIRILIIEDNKEQECLFSAWLPPDVRAVVAKSTGAALGIFKRDVDSAYAGILLDHDLSSAHTLGPMSQNC